MQTCMQHKETDYRCVCLNKLLVKQWDNTSSTLHKHGNRIIDIPGKWSLLFPLSANLDSTVTTASYTWEAYLNCASRILSRISKRKYWILCWQNTSESCEQELTWSSYDHMLFICSWFVMANKSNVELRRQQNLQQIYSSSIPSFLIGKGIPRVSR